MSRCKIHLPHCNVSNYTVLLRKKIRKQYIFWLAVFFSFLRRRRISTLTFLSINLLFNKNLNNINTIEQNKSRRVVFQHALCKLGSRSYGKVLLDSTFINKLVYIFWIMIFFELRFHGVHLEVTLAVNMSSFRKNAQCVFLQVRMFHFLEFTGVVEDIIRYSRFALANAVVFSELSTRCLPLNSDTFENL
jgi:hypothetical protein